MVVVVVVVEVVVVVVVVSAAAAAAVVAVVVGVVVCKRPPTPDDTAMLGFSIILTLHGKLLPNCAPARRWRIQQSFTAISEGGRP